MTNLVIALLIVVVVGYAITDALARSLTAEEQLAQRSTAHRRADDEGFGPRPSTVDAPGTPGAGSSGHGERGGSQRIDGGPEF